MKILKTLWKWKKWNKNQNLFREYNNNLVQTWKHIK